ncbi:hypothetical protein GCM10010429_47950 [Micromonospora olivasterospora]|uniref:Sigma-70-like protein n=1 Tax=Micromonospora olivasterospora TaxID=1880 RepID=A0A562I5G5_MICOL|nr:sigma-70-like protein [Micromonospora olivasterospora]
MTFEEYSTRGPALLRLARLLTGDEHRAEDLTQDVLARAYVHWRRIAGVDRPDVYVRRMLVNANAPGGGGAPAGSWPHRPCPSDPSGATWAGRRPTATRCGG